MTDRRAPAFLAAAHAWIRSHVTVTGEIEQTHVQWWSTVFRVPTSDGSVWFKATVDGATFEPPLTLLLAQLRPVVPELIAPPRLCSRRSAPTTSTASLWPAAVPRVRTDRRLALGGRAPGFRERESGRLPARHPLGHRRTTIPPSGTSSMMHCVAEQSTRVVESVDRALRLLQELAEHGSGVTLSELASTTGLPKSSLHRTLGALQERGFATQRDDARYLLGAELLRIAFEFQGRLDLRVLLRPTLERVRATLNETVHVGVLDGPDVVYVDKLESTRPLSLTSKIGGRNPAHATAVGKALLAWAYPTQASITEWVRRDGPLVRRTSRTIVDASHLAKELSRVRADGFSKDLEESEPGVRCLATPVFFGGAVPIAAISVSAPKDRLPTGMMPEVAALLVQEAADLRGP